MPWPLKFITIARVCYHCRTPVVDTPCECPQSVKEGWRGSRHVDVATGEPPVVGDTFYHEEAGRRFTQKYHDQSAVRRKPICVVLPGRTWWMVDTYAYNGDQGEHGEGWDVTGDIQPGRPTLTCSPSINCVGSYHGYVTDGVITNDVEGRTFSADGAKCQ